MVTYLHPFIVMGNRKLIDNRSSEINNRNTIDYNRIFLYVIFW